VTQGRVAAVIAALAVVGFCRTAYFHFVSEPRRERPIPGPPIDAQFRALLPLLPRTGEAGYVTDEPVLQTPGFEYQGAKQRFLQMQYALAPLVLRYDDDRAPLVIAHVADPAHLDEVLRAHGLAAIARAGPTTAVARPR
jgi:hypothetical protein